MARLNPVRLTVRNAIIKDIPGIVRLSEKIYGDDAVTRQMVRGQITSFPEGQFVAEYEGEIVGHCATFIVDGELALKPHTWDEITGNGYASRHDEDGDFLYGMEVVVDPKRRGMRIGQRLYDARKRLCHELNLRGIVFGGRMPGYRRAKRKVGSAEEYVRQVREKRIRDLVINFQLANDFEIEGVLPGYLPTDHDSMGYATLMVWRNPLLSDASSGSAKQRGRLKGSVRVATVQLQVRKIDSLDQFERHIEYFVDVASDYRADFVVFPELLTTPLLSMETKHITPEQSVKRITAYTDRFIKFMRELAISYNVNIIGGSHLTEITEGTVQNISYVFLRDGSVHSQPKLHPTPNERYWWNIKGGDKLETIMTDCGPIGVLICYDSEFPETARHLVDQGAVMLFIPFCTDERQGYLRVRYCAQARAVENQVYVVMAGMVGNLPDVENMDIHYAESCILTPCDFPFARDGISAEAAPNTETITFADLQLEHLMMGRNSGTVQNLKDRRFDLYRVQFYKK